jgi:hypothetical protein
MAENDTDRTILEGQPLTADDWIPRQIDVETGGPDL